MTLFTTIFDTETTGLDDPYPVQLAFKVRWDGRVINTTNVLVNCGVPIEPGAEAVHGISNEMIRDLGITPERAIEMWMDFTGRTNRYIAHNIFFDAKAVRNLLRLGGYDTRADAWKEELRNNSFCTMLKTTKLCNLPKPSGRGGPKWPKLQEAHRILLGYDFAGAHDAMIDVEACERVYNWLLENGHA